MDFGEAMLDYLGLADWYPQQPPRYDSGMTKKIAVSLPDELVAAANRAVTDGRAASVSAYVASALARQVREDDLAVLVADMRAEQGPPTAEDYAWADAVLGIR
jgi:Arc/MetJ-type ribon-helix-helix transcriptional regulator